MSRLLPRPVPQCRAFRLRVDLENNIEFLGIPAAPGVNLEAAPLRDYELCSSARERCVFNVVGTFTAHVSQYDRDRMYTEFQSPQSTIRIMFATTSLGMGINIADVARVVTWKIPINNSLGDLWQRLARGGRGVDRTSISYIMLPCWLFNSEGCYRPGSSLGDTRKNFSQALPKVLKRQRNQMPIDRALLRSYLSQGVTPGDAIDIDEDPAELPGTQIDSQETAETSKRRLWTKAEMTKRDETDTPFLRMVNGLCHREGFLRELGEHRLVQSERQDVDPNRCCSSCAPDLLPILKLPPERAKPLRFPRSGTHAWFVCTALNSFAVERATVLYSTSDTRFPYPPGAYMGTACRLTLGYACTNDYQKGADVANSLAATWIEFDALCVHVPILLSWDLRQTEGDVLMAAIPGIMAKALETFMSYQEESRVKQALKKAALSTNSTQPSTSPSTASDFVGQRHQRDEDLANQVTHRLKARVAEGTLFKAPLKPTVPVASAAVNYCTPQTPRTPRTPRIPRTPLGEQPPTALNAAVEVQTPTLNKASLTFTPTSSRGRTRILSAKGKENYR